MDEEMELTLSESNIQDEINFVETDAEYIASDIISRFEEYLGEALYPGDERRIFLQGISYLIADQLIHINETGRENLLRYATGNKLDGIGESYFLTNRLEATFATTVIKFTLSDAQSADVIIPKGTRVTPDGKAFFATDEEIVFPAKSVELEKEVSATATVGGISHNDFEAGQINKLVDTNPYISSVSNTIASDNGSDRESDDEYRERLRIAPFAFSVAGPSNAYESIAMSASSEIGDVHAYSPSPGVVEIAVIKDNGEIPTSNDDVLTLILDTCSAKDRRPLTDNVKVVPATGVDTNISVTYYVANNDTSKKKAIESAVDEYKAWQVEKIGRDINPDKLRSLMFSAGAARIEITSPTYTSLEENEIAKIGTVTITYGGSISM